MGDMAPLQTQGFTLQKLGCCHPSSTYWSQVKGIHLGVAAASSPERESVCVCVCVCQFKT